MNVPRYVPLYKGRESDFLLFCSKVGLLIFEVKDWALDQIQKANPDQFFIYSGGKRIPAQTLLNRHANIRMT